MAIQRGNAASAMGTLDRPGVRRAAERKAGTEEEEGQQQKKQQHKQGSAELTLSDEKMANIHPLLREELEHSSQTQHGSELFSCIDPNKLHRALETAAALSTVEQEGVPASMLRLSQAKGIFPTAYVQVLSHEQLRELYSLKRRLLYCMMLLPMTSSLRCSQGKSYPSRRVMS